MVPSRKGPLAVNVSLAGIYFTVTSKSNKKNVSNTRYCTSILPLFDSRANTTMHIGYIISYVMLLRCKKLLRVAMLSVMTHTQRRLVIRYRPGALRASHDAWGWGWGWGRLDALLPESVQKVASKCWVGS